MSADYEKRGLVIVGDEAWTPEEWAERERRRQYDRDRYQRPERKAQQIAAVLRYRERYPERFREYRRTWNQKHRRHLVGSLHSLSCFGPTKATGCRCHKIKVYDKPEVRRVP